MSHWHFCHVCLSFRVQPTSRAARIGQKADRELLHSVQAYFHLASKLPQPSESPVRPFSYNLSTPSMSSGCPTLGLLIIATAFLFSTPQQGLRVSFCCPGLTSTFCLSDVSISDLCWGRSYLHSFLSVFRLQLVLLGCESSAPAGPGFKHGFHG